VFLRRKPADETPFQRVKARADRNTKSI